MHDPKENSTYIDAEEQNNHVLIAKHADMIYAEFIKSYPAAGSSEIELMFCMPQTKKKLLRHEAVSFLPSGGCRRSVVLLSYLAFWRLFQGKEKLPKPCSSRSFLGGDYWTRTSDLLRVKQAL